MTTKKIDAKKDTSAKLKENLHSLKLQFIKENYESFALEAAKKQFSHIDYLEELIDGEALMLQDRSTNRRIKTARFPVIKTMEHFNWTWPKKINRMQIQNIFRLQFVKQKGNIIFLGGVGLGKTHLASALGYSSCLHGHSVLFVTAIDAINTLVAAKEARRLKQELKKYLRPDLLILDELGYLPIDKQGADLLFQIISLRYEQGAMILTSNRAYKNWTEIFNNDSILTSAILDRILHHAETVVIEGKSFRMKDQIEL